MQLTAHYDAPCPHNPTLNHDDGERGERDERDGSDKDECNGDTDERNDWTTTHTLQHLAYARGVDERCDKIYESIGHAPSIVSLDVESRERAACILFLLVGGQHCRFL